MVLACIITHFHALLLNICLHPIFSSMLIHAKVLIYLNFMACNSISGIISVILKHNYEHKTQRVESTHTYIHLNTHIYIFYRISINLYEEQHT